MKDSSIRLETHDPSLQTRGFTTMLCSFLKLNWLLFSFSGLFSKVHSFKFVCAYLTKSITRRIYNLHTASIVRVVPIQTDRTRIVRESDYSPASQLFCRVKKTMTGNS